MSIAPAPGLEEFIRMVKQMRELRCLDAKGPEDDIGFPYVEWIRDRRVVAQSIVNKIDRDHALHIAHMGVVGYGADSVRLALDAHVQVLEPEEVERYRAEGVRGDGAIRDALLIHEHARDGSNYYRPLVYTVDYSTETLTWISTPSQDYAGADFEGVIPSALKHAFSVPTLQEEMQEAGVKVSDFDLPDWQAALHRDLAVTKKIIEITGAAIGIKSTGPEADAIIQESIDRWEDGEMYTPTKLMNRSPIVPRPSYNLEMK